MICMLSLRGLPQRNSGGLRQIETLLRRRHREERPLTFRLCSGGLASWLYMDIAGGDYDTALAETVGCARKAIEIDPLDAEGHIELAGKLAVSGDFAQSEAEVERGLRLNPSSADVMMKAAMPMAWLGRAERGVEHATGPSASIQCRWFGTPSTASNPII